MNKELMIAILAMDSYNRGYSQGLRLNSGDADSAQEEAGRSIGNAHILVQDQASAALEASFYAIAYVLDGEVIVSYRGSDYEDEPGASSIIPNDIWEGWSAITGWEAGQVGLAIKFYENVVDIADTSQDIVGISLTGHSLGGMLAGIVSTLYGNQALIFDHLPFGFAAETHAQAAGLTGSLYFDVPKSIYVEGEIAQELRDGALGEFFENFVRVPAQSDFDRTIELEDMVDKTALDDYDTSLGYVEGAVRRHSQSLLVHLLYAKNVWEAPQQNGGLARGIGWRSISPILFDALHNDAIGESLGWKEGGAGIGTGQSTPGNQLAYSIAYSAISEGERPFGDTAIEALFDDADDLGIVRSALPVWIDDELLSSFGDVMVEYAGLLATNRALKSERPDAVDGIFTISRVGAGSNEPAALLIDFSDTTWTADALGGQSHEISMQGELVAGIIGKTIATYSSQVEADFISDELGGWLGRINPSSSIDPFELIDGVVISLIGGSAVYQTTAERYQLIVGTDNAESYNLVGAPTIFLAGGGDDYVKGTGGDDALLGGLGADTLIGGAGNDFFFGGPGSDIILGDAAYGDNDGYDTAVYADPGTVRLSYDGTGVSHKLIVNGNDGGQDTLTSIEYLRISASKTIFDLRGTIGDDVNLTVEALGGVELSNNIRQAVSGKNLEHGIRAHLNGPDGSSQLSNADTSGDGGGVITLAGFKTDIIGTDYDDDLFDGSDEAKSISGGAGDDRISVAGTSASAVLLGGSGVDEIIGGSGNDFIVDQDGGTEVASRPSSGGGFPGGNPSPGGSTQPVASIDGGAGNDTIIISYGPDITTPPPLEPGAFSIFGSRPHGTQAANTASEAARAKILTPGEGDDCVFIDAIYGTIFYQYGQGDGDDVVTVKAFNSVEYAPNLNAQPTEVPGDIYQPGFNFDFSDFASSEITAEFIVESQRVIGEYLPNNDFAPLWEVQGDLKISFANGGSITINDYYGLWDAEEFRFDPAVENVYTTSPAVSVDLGIRFKTADQGQVTIAITDQFSSNPGSTQRAPGQSLAKYDTIASTQQTSTASSSSQGSVFLAPGEHSYEGGDGVDRLVVSWDLDSLTSTLNGSNLIIEDKWGLIGKTILANFDEIYAVEENRIYSVEEFDAALASRGEGEIIVGSEASDVLVGTERRDHISGLAGDDALSGLAGNDFLDGGAGADMMSGGKGDDLYIVDDPLDAVIELVDEGDDLVQASVDYQLTNNVEHLVLLGGAASGTGNGLANRLTGNVLANNLSGLAGDDRLFGLEGDDILSGGDGNDQIDGGSGSDVLNGGQGDDILQGGEGADMMTGGDGNDYYFVDDAGDQVIEQAGEGYDTIESSVDYQLLEGQERLILMRKAVLGEGNASNNHIIGTNAKNTLLGHDGADRIDGKGGADFIDGGNGDDMLFGGAGPDSIFGRDGNDTINGESGDDIIHGDGGDDLINGGAGDDILYGGDGADILYGRKGHDRIFGGDGADMLYGLSGEDKMYGGTGQDVLYGGAGDDIMYGGSGNDVLHGEKGADRVFGLSQDDLIVQVGATDGRDFIDGGSETDTYKLLGSAGAEDFTFYTRDAWLEIAGNIASDLDIDTEIVVTRNGSDNAHVISELNDIEEIIVDTLNVTPIEPGAPTGGTSGSGDTVSVVGDFTTTSLNFNTITVNSGANADTVDISGLKSAHRLVFNGGGGADSIVGKIRPQDVVNFSGTGQTPTDISHALADASFAIDLSTSNSAFRYPEQFMLNRQVLVQVDPYDLSSRFTGEFSSNPYIREYQEGGMRLILPVGLEGGDSVLSDNLPNLHSSTNRRHLTEESHPSNDVEPTDGNRSYEPPAHDIRAVPAMLLSSSDLDQHVLLNEGVLAQRTAQIRAHLTSDSFDADEAGEHSYGEMSNDEGSLSVKLARIRQDMAGFAGQGFGEGHGLQNQANHVITDWYA